FRAIATIELVSRTAAVRAPEVAPVPSRAVARPTAFWTIAARRPIRGLTERLACPDPAHPCCSQRFTRAHNPATPPAWGGGTAGGAVTAAPGMPGAGAPEGTIRSSSGSRQGRAFRPLLSCGP